MPGIKGIGRLDEKIVIQQEVIETNDYNEAVASSWEQVANPWARVEDEDSAVDDRYFEGEQITPRRTVKITIRYRRGLNEKMRIYRKERYYQINSISQPDRNTRTVIKAILIDET